VIKLIDIEMRKSIIIFFLHTLFLIIHSGTNRVLAQAVLVANYKLDNCSADDYVGNNDGFILGRPCVCGVQAEGFKLNGSSDFVEFGSGLSSTFSGDFSLSFYVQFDPLDNSPMDVFSIAQRCKTDSVFLLRYIPDFNKIQIDFSDSPDNRFRLNGAVDNPSCWNYIVFTKVGSIGSLFINEVLVDQSSSISILSLNVSDNLSLGNSPCATIVPNTDRRFRGSIDEIQIYNGALTQREIIARNLRPDQIVTNDTTIFAGESLQLLTGGTCASDFLWTPSEGLSSDSELEPIASPAIGTHVYSLTITNGDCEITDDVTVNVVDRDKVTCQDLMLPSAFTPNNDGINDDFGISNLFLVDELISLEIFNKWGGRVFGTRQISTQWNALHDNMNEPVPSGSFLYKVKYICEGQEYIKSGTVTVLR
jgi:gliding motility-associated-like protein